MTEPRESLSSRIVVPVAVAVLVALLAGGTAPWWWDRVFSPTSTTSPGSTVAPPTLGPTPATSIVVPSPSGASGSGGPQLGGCVLTITYPFATIRDEPRHDATETGDVPEGDYEASNTTLADWAGREERWFEITASGRTGWIVYNGIMIESKSAECP